MLSLSTSPGASLYMSRGSFPFVRGGRANFGFARDVKTDYVQGLDGLWTARDEFGVEATARVVVESTEEWNERGNMLRGVTVISIDLYGEHVTHRVAGKWRTCVSRTARAHGRVTRSVHSRALDVLPDLLGEIVGNGWA
jgi:hypothetical protein